MPRIAIIGPGLLGGSIALKLRELGGWHISLWARRPEALADLRTRNLVDEISGDLAAICSDADLVILCVPVNAMPALAAELARCIKPTCIVTDVGSVKASVVAELAPILGSQFIGSHPMAGKAESGIDAAEASLFADTNCIITSPSLPVREFWEKLGCRVVELSPREHDECVALISHLPHIVAGALIRAVAEKNSTAFAVVGPGFRDTTRVAGGPPELWTGIITANQPAIIAALDAMISKLTNFRQTVAQADWNGVTNSLIAAKQTREQIKFPHPPQRSIAR